MLHQLPIGGNFQRSTAPSFIDSVMRDAVRASPAARFSFHLSPYDFAGIKLFVGPRVAAHG